MIKIAIAILPSAKKRKLFSFFIKTIFLNILDLVSVAYLIPAIILLLDKEKLYTIINKIGIDSSFINDKNIIIFIAILLLFYILKNLLQVKFNKNLFDFLYQLSSDISDKIIRNFIAKDYLSYQKKEKGKMINIVLMATNDFCCKYLHAYVLLFSEVFILTIISCVLFYFYPFLTLGSLLVLICFSGFIYYKKKSDFKLINSTFNKTQSSTNSKLINILEGYLEIKSSQNENHFINTFNTDNRRLNTVTSKLVSTNFNYSKYLELTLIICLGVVIYFNLESPKNNVLLIATLGALGFRLVPSLSKILTATTNIKSHSYTVKLLHDILDETTQKATNTITHFSSEIIIDKVSFEYQKNKNIVEDIEFSIKRGDFFGISGVSGIGKTTFLHLIIGLIKPNKGQILIDNKQIKNTGFLSFIKYVPQQPYLLSGTLLENLTMYRKDKNIDYEYLNYLCNRLDLSSMIEGLEDNYNTAIHHDSLRFSGGQKQRISLVRALYGKPDLLILDEATNQQNKQLEIQIFDFLKELSSKNKMAVIAVSHNESLSSYYDKTYILKNKKLIFIA